MNIANPETTSGYPASPEKPATPSAAPARTALARLRRALGMLAGMLFIASLIKELRTPAEKRAWHGTILGFVPYDLRLPSPARFKEVYWNTESHRLVGGRLFGVGWTVNIYEVVARIRGLLGSAPAPASV
ncbi:MAG TPA: hypothetical protein VFN74_24940 [Chloroflexota bacterium]|nr:hypothetical protein [Chloroflexota bacterium]